MVLNTYFPYIKQASVSVQCNYTDYIHTHVHKANTIGSEQIWKNNIHIDYNNSKNDCNVQTALSLQKSHKKYIYMSSPRTTVPVKY